MKHSIATLLFFLAFSAFADKVTMTCPSISCMSCQGKITKTLSTIDGIDKKSVSVDIEKKTVTFDYKLVADSNKRAQEKNKLQEKLTEEMKKLGYPIDGDFVWDNNDNKDKKTH